MRKMMLLLIKAIVVILIVAFLAAVLLARLTHHDTVRRPACVNNLKQIGLVLNMYTNEHKGKFPPIDDTKNNFMFEGDVIYPKYLSDTTIVACPSDPEYNPSTNFRLISTNHPSDSSAVQVHPDCITDMSYVYLGWLITSDEEAEAFFEAYDKLPPEDYDKDIIVPDGKGNGGGNIIHRLRNDADRFMGGNPDVDSEYPGFDIPIAWDRPYIDPSQLSHIPAGGNVLYLSGHVSFIRFGTQFPMTETMARLLNERPRERIPDCDE